MTTKKTVAWSLFLAVVAFIQLVCLFIIACRNIRWLAENWFSVASIALIAFGITFPAIWKYLSRREQRKDKQEQREKREGTVEIFADHWEKHTNTLTIRQVDINIRRKGTDIVTLKTACIQIVGEEEAYVIPKKDISGIKLPLDLSHGDEPRCHVGIGNFLAALKRGFTAADFPIFVRVIFIDLDDKPYISKTFKIPTDKRDSESHEPGPE